MIPTTRDEGLVASIPCAEGFLGPVDYSICMGFGDFDVSDTECGRTR
jgi:hypothetical protein